MTFQEIKTPEELMSFLDQNIKYDIIDNNGIPYYNSNSEKFQEVCKTLRTTYVALKSRNRSSAG